MTLLSRISATSLGLPAPSDGTAVAFDGVGVPPTLCDRFYPMQTLWYGGQLPLEPAHPFGSSFGNFRAVLAISSAEGLT
jgi:hypothetical protein